MVSKLINSLFTRVSIFEEDIQMKDSLPEWLGASEGKFCEILRKQSSELFTCILLFVNARKPRLVNDPVLLCGTFLSLNTVTVIRKQQKCSSHFLLINLFAHDSYATMRMKNFRKYLIL